MNEEKAMLKLGTTKVEQALISFVNVHARKVEVSNDRCVYLAEYNENGVNVDVVLKQYTIEQIISNFDTNDQLIRWLIQQIQTYNVKKEIVLGLIFSKSEILAHVIRKIID